MVEIPVGQSVAPDLNFAKVEILLNCKPKKKILRDHIFVSWTFAIFYSMLIFIKHASGAIRRIFGNETKLNK